ncbi:MAG TPA: POTRA domain-containing protein, partial [Ignavibacteria bacterium]|nr:POTRA domain-containing protein [Ignavibacteria bacterium]
MITLKNGALYSENQLQLDVNNIIKNYNLAGYLDANITKINKEYNFDSSQVDLIFSITEGSQTLIGELIFEGNRLLNDRQIAEMINSKPGDVLDQGNLNADVTELLNYYESKGYTFASIVIKNIETYKTGENTKLRIKINIDENEKIKINRIIIEGNSITNDEVITREINLGRDKSVTRENLIEIKNRLDNLGYFETVEQPKILKYKNETVLFIKVKEGNTNTFDGILGYVPPAANETTGYITGIANVSLKNLFGTGRKLDARYEKEVRTTQELELKYLEPWFLGFPV